MKYSIETQIKLNSFSPRNYQLPLYDAIENKGYKKVLYIAPRRCLSGSSHILMANGDYKLLEDIRPGDKIMSWNGDKFVEDEVISIWKTSEKRVYSIRAPGLPPLLSSADHQFAVSHCGQINVNWKKLSDIKSDLVNIFAGSSFGERHNPDLAEFLGYMSSDGYVSGYSQPKFTNTNEGILRRVADLSEKLFDYKPIWRAKGNGYDLGFSNGTKGGGTFENKIKELFRCVGLDIPKRYAGIHPLILDMDEQSVGRFLAGVISGDGCLFIGKKGFIASDTDNIIPPPNEIAISCGYSDRYAWGIYWLLRKMGIVSQVPKKEKSSNWKIRVSKNGDIKKLLSFGPIYGKEDKQKQLLEAIDSYTKKKQITYGCFRSKPRIIDLGYQEEMYDIEVKNNNNFVANGYLVHNSGKDLVAFNIAIRYALEHVCVIYYCFPTFSLARRALWDNITISGLRVLDYIPDEVIESKNEQQMRIRFRNGSIIQLIGSDNYNETLIGTNPKMIVFSEYALQDPMAYQFARPILAANNGVALFVSTPRGKNHMWELYQIAQQSPEWFAYKLTIEDTQHLTAEAWDSEKREMSEDLLAQEYYCSFELGVEGSIYGKYIDKMKLKGQIGVVPWESSARVHTAWDIGRDTTSIIFFQTIGQVVRVIDYYEKSQENLAYFVKILEQKPYMYGKHFFPHDMSVTEWAGAKITRLDKAKELGLKDCNLVPTIPLEDGIEHVRVTFDKMWIDEKNCAQLIKCLENYRREFDDKKRVYGSKPRHDFASHASDCMRYMCLSLSKTRQGITAQELDNRYAQARYGNDANLPPIFRDGIAKRL